MKNKLTNFLKYGILVFGISLFLLNCEKENDFEQENQIVDNSIPLETVSIDEAKNFLNILSIKGKSTSNNNENLVIVDPDWSTIKQDSLKYSDALLTRVEATFKNSYNNKKADVLFIKVDDQVISVLYSTFPMEDGKEILHITELNGDFIDSYIVEDGLLIKRLFFTKKENTNLIQNKIQQRREYPIGCDDIMNIVNSLYDIFGFSVSSCDGGGGSSGSYNIYGSFGTMSFNGITITATGSDQRRNNNRQDNTPQDCETSNCDDQNTTNGGSGSNTNNTRTEADKQREMALRISVQKKKCKDKGMLYVKGKCIVDTEAPCPKEGMIRNSEGMCEKTIATPSCESFNFIITAPFWQESAVKNIRFNVYILDNNGIRYAYSQLYSQPILFGMPSNLSNGGPLTAGIAAEISADVLNKTIQETVQKFTGSFIISSEVDLFFKEKLKSNYSTYIPGGRVQFNSTSTLITSEYKSNLFGTGNCN